MALHLPGKIEETIARTGAWEPKIAALIVFFVQEASVFVDVGANIGFHTLHAAALHGSVRCVAFESRPAVHARLAQNVRLNPELTGIAQHRLALADGAG